MICDNLSAHKTQKVQQFLSEHPTVSIPYTPTCSSWLDQVELWFAKIQRDVIARGVFTSVTDLKRKLIRYIRHYNKETKPVKWSYRNPSHRITTDSSVTVPSPRQYHTLERDHSDKYSQLLTCRV